MAITLHWRQRFTDVWEAACAPPLHSATVYPAIGGWAWHAEVSVRDKIGTVRQHLSGVAVSVDKAQEFAAFHVNNAVDASEKVKTSGGG
ncbi:MAG TPA: hypothetical protein VGK74_22365 [Symbiobacteriaceae bacterium]|jgi:hypothetical protein